jgi:hypothetical protein
VRYVQKIELGPSKNILNQFDDFSMAAWHFEIALIAREGLIRAHGSIPRFLEEYQPMSEDFDFKSAVFTDYWNGVDPRMELLDDARKIVPEYFVSTKENLLVGESDGNRFVLWTDQAYFNLDLRSPDLEVLNDVVRMAKKGIIC